MNFTACLRADELRDELRPAPARDQPEQDLGAREVAHRGRDRPVVAVERDLDASAQRGAVDRCESEKREVAEPAEELVPRPTALSRALGGDVLELVHVGADGEHERLSGQQEPAPISRPQLVEDAFERAQRLLAEGVRLLPALPVVDRHERDRADARLEALQLEEGRASRHAGGSPRGERRPFRARCRARSARSARRGDRGTRARAGPSA